jgi:arylsulfatase
MLHEGGIAAPLVVHWPKGLKTNPGTLTHSPGYLTDVMPTALEVAGTTYPISFNGQQLHPLAGRSLVPIFQTGSRPDPEWMFWEQYGNRAVRHGNWKAVRPAEAKEWELYDLQKDRTELNDMAKQYPDVLSRMTEAWEKWANANQVLPKKISNENKR